MAARRVLDHPTGECLHRMLRQWWQRMEDDVAAAIARVIVMVCCALLHHRRHGGLLCPLRHSLRVLSPPWEGGGEESKRWWGRYWANPAPQTESVVPTKPLTRVVTPVATWMLSHVKTCSTFLSVLSATVKEVHFVTFWIVVFFVIVTRFYGG